MSEITAEGYQTIKDFLNSSVTTPDEWDYIEIYDDTGSAITRVSISLKAALAESEVPWLTLHGRMGGSAIAAAAVNALAGDVA